MAITNANNGANFQDGIPHLEKLAKDYPNERLVQVILGQLRHRGILARRPVGKRHVPAQYRMRSCATPAQFRGCVQRRAVRRPHKPHRLCRSAPQRP